MILNYKLCNPLAAIAPFARRRSATCNALPEGAQRAVPDDAKGIFYAK